MSVKITKFIVRSILAIVFLGVSFVAITSRMTTKAMREELELIKANMEMVQESSQMSQPPVQDRLQPQPRTQPQVQYASRVPPRPQPQPRPQPKTQEGEYPIAPWEYQRPLEIVDIKNFTIYRDGKITVIGRPVVSDGTSAWLYADKEPPSDIKLSNDSKWLTSDWLDEEGNLISDWYKLEVAREEPANSGEYVSLIGRTRFWEYPEGGGRKRMEKVWTLIMP